MILYDVHRRHLCSYKAPKLGLDAKKTSRQEEQTATMVWWTREHSRTHHHESSIHTYDAVELHRINHFWFVLVKFTYFWIQIPDLAVSGVFFAVITHYSWVSLSHGPQSWPIFIPTHANRIHTHYWHQWSLNSSLPIAIAHHAYSICYMHGTSAYSCVMKKGWMFTIVLPALWSLVTATWQFFLWPAI